MFFAKRVYEPDLAVDLAAETFAEALVSRGRMRARTEEEATAWLFGIARHQLSRYFRRGVAERKALSRLGIDSPELSEEERDRIEDLADRDRLQHLTARALRGLSIEQQQALRLRIVEELPYSEVAQRLGTTEDGARARVSRGLRSLGRRLDGDEMPEEAT